MHTHVCRDPCEHDVSDSSPVQHQVEIGGVKRTLAGLVDDRFPRLWIELGDDVPARFAAHQHAPARPWVADAGTDLSRPPALVLRQITEVRPMPLARMED